MAELKKCPFCGGEAKLVYDSLPNKQGKLIAIVRVRCKGLNCTLRPTTEWHESLEEATEHWNNRVTEAEIRAKAIDEFVEKLKADLLEMHWINIGSRCTFERMIDKIAEQLKEET